MEQSRPIHTTLVISMGFLVLYVWLDIQWALWVALGAGLVGVVSTGLARKIEWLWFKLAWVLGKVVPNLLLASVFFLLLMPLAKLSKLLGKRDPLQLKAATLSSNFREVEPQILPDAFEKTW